MTWLNIRTEGFSNDALFPRRHITIGEKEFETPTKAIPVRKTRDHQGEELAEASRGVCELHRGVSTEKLRSARHGNMRAITGELQTGYRKAKGNEVVFTFLSWKEGQTFGEAGAQVFVDVIETFSDILTVPLMPELVEAVEEDRLSDTAYQEYRQNVSQFLETARIKHPEAPIMGVIPALGWEFTDDLMRLYEKYNVRAFCMNLNRTRITAGTKVEIVKPMMRHIARRDIADNVLFYGINLHPGDYDDSLGLRPAADMASFGMGFDIVGENHVSPSIPEEAFEDDETVTFKLFDREEFAYKEVLLAELPQHFPEKTRFDVDEVVQRAARSDNQRRRLEKLVNAEQMALAAKELQVQIPSGITFKQLAKKRGVTPKIARAFQSVRDGFDDGQSQSSLSDF